MNGQRLLPPGVFVALDAFGVLLVVLGVLALTGTDFGRPVLIRAAPGLIAIGAALMVPMIVWIIRRAVALSGKPGASGPQRSTPNKRPSRRSVAWARFNV